MAPTKRTSVGDGKGATVVEEKRKLLQQYKDDDGHFSLVRYVSAHLHFDSCGKPSLLLY